MSLDLLNDLLIHKVPEKYISWHHKDNIRQRRYGSLACWIEPCPGKGGGPQSIINIVVPSSEPQTTNSSDGVRAQSILMDSCLCPA